MRISLTYPTSFLIVFMITTFSGVLRKWALPHSSVSNLFFVFQLVSPLLLLSQSVEGKQVPNYLKTGLVSYTSLLILFAVNPLNTTIFHGLAGVYIHMLFFGIVSYGTLVRSGTTLDKIVPVLMVTLIFQCLIAAVQYHSAENLSLGAYLADSDNEVSAFVGDSVRASGTFSYVAGMSAFCQFSTFLFCYMLKIRGTHWLTVLTGTITAFNCLFNGSRGTVIFFLITVTVFCMSTFPPRRMKHLTGTIRAPIFIVGVIVLLPKAEKMLRYIARPIANIMARIKDGQSEFSTRMITDLTDPMTRSFDYANFGIGLGSTYQGANELFGTSPLLRGVPYEGELFRLMIEGGILLVACRFIILACCLSALRFPFLFKLYLLFILGFCFQLVFNIYSAIYCALGLNFLNSAYAAPRKD